MNKITEREKGVVEGVIIGVVVSLLVGVVIAITKYGDWVDGVTL